MNQSEQLSDLTAALAKAQAKIKGAAKDSTNPFFNSKYADLASVWDACREALTENGLAVLQSPSTEFGGTPEVYTYQTKKGEERSGVRVATTVKVATRITHSSGQWIEGEAAAMLPAADPQAVGSAITYLRRYGLASMVGVAPEDDDAEGTTRPVPQKERKPEGVNEQGQLVVPFGTAKGKVLEECSTKFLLSIKDWCEERDAFPKHVTKIDEILEARRANEPQSPATPPGDAAEPPAKPEDELLMVRIRMTNTIRERPGFFLPSEAKALKEWAYADGRTLQELLNKESEIDHKALAWDAEREKGRTRVKA